MIDAFRNGECRRLTIVFIREYFLVSILKLSALIKIKNLLHYFLRVVLLRDFEKSTKLEGLKLQLLLNKQFLPI